MEHMLHPRPGYPFALELEHRVLALRAGAPRADDGDERRHRRMSVRRRRAPVPDDRDTDRRHRGPAGARRTRCSTRTSALSVGAAPVEGTEYDFREGATDRVDEARPRGSPISSATGTGSPASSCAIPNATEGSRSWVDETYPYLMLFTGDPLPDVKRRSLAVEPMTCPPNAFRTGETLILLEPGASSPASGASRRPRAPDRLPCSPVSARDIALGTRQH